MDLLHWFLVLLPYPDEDPYHYRPRNHAKMELWAQIFLDFIDLCVANIIILYKKEKASPRAIDEYGRSALHHLSRSQVRRVREVWTM